MKVKITIPESLQDLTLSQYQKYMVFAESEDVNENFCALKMVQIFCRLDISNVNQIALTDFTFINDKINTLFKAENKWIPERHRRFKIEGQEFGFIPNFEKLSTGEFIDLSEFIGSVSTFHKAMAIMYRPITYKHKELYKIEKYTDDTVGKYEDIMKGASLDILFGANFFFYNLARDLLKAIPNYLQRQTSKQIPGIYHLKNYLQSIGDGNVLFTDFPKEIYYKSIKLQN